MHGRVARLGRLVAVPVSVLMVLGGFAAAPAGAATSVTGTGICFGYPTTGGCRVGFGGSTTASPGSTLALDAALTATDGVSSGQQIVLDASGTGIAFSGNNHDYQVNNDTTMFGCSVSSVSLSNAAQTVSVSMPSGCATTGANKLVVLAGSTAMPNTPGSFSLSLHTTNDPTPVTTNSLSLLTVPSAPKNLSATGRNVSIDLSWDAPDSNGGTSLSAYNAYCTPAPATPDINSTPSATTDGSTTSTTVTGLPAHETFNCVVTAVNSVGQSVASDVASARPIQKPSQVPNFTAARGNASASLSWGRPGDNGGSPITAYHVYCSTTFPPNDDPGDLCGTFAPSKRSAVVRGLTNGVTYFFGITAENAAGESSISGYPQVTPATRPTPPRAVRAIPGTGSILLRWRAPASDGGDAITGYDAYCSVDDPPVVTGPPSATSATDRVRVKGLTSGTPYYCVVFARNTVNRSASSVVVTATPL